MSNPVLVCVRGAVAAPRDFSWADLAALDGSCQVADVGRLDARRQGTAVTLAGLLAICRPLPAARWLTLHASRDDFHASIPLAAVRERAVLIYQLDGQPLPEKAGGPLRFFIPDFQACHSAEIDECANVKFVDCLELSAEPGRDNRPADERAHARLHGEQTANAECRIDDMRNRDD